MRQSFHPLTRLISFVIRSLMVGPSNFGLKFSGGRALPGEIVWFLKYAQINRSTELATWGIPELILDAIESMDLKHPYDFTAYAEGSPTLPS
jgi:hypothetical protein